MCICSARDYPCGKNDARDDNGGNDNETPQDELGGIRDVFRPSKTDADQQQQAQAPYRIDFA
jgi:hypothetical protein